MSTESHSQHPPDAALLELLRSPTSHEKLEFDHGWLHTEDGRERFAVHASGIPLFAESACTPEGERQKAHYDRVASAYLENLGYPHTQEYSAYLDRAFLDLASDAATGRVLELCCGGGEALRLLRDRVQQGVGVDVSTAMLQAAARDFGPGRFAFVQADATLLPLASGSFDSVFMLGGVHHVVRRAELFAEVFRVLRPGGRLYFREPVSDFILWRALRAVIYRVSPSLDHETERPLLWSETVPPLEMAGFRVRAWNTYGFLGFCLFMNSDILQFNRLFRFAPRIRDITRAFCSLDEVTRHVPGLERSGLIVMAMAEKPAA